MAEDLFTPGEDKAPQNPDPEKNYLEELVGEGKKFKTPEDLARGKAESDTFIAQILKEQAELRAELDKRLTVEAVVEKLGNKLEPSASSQPNQSADERDDENTATLTSEQVEELARKTFKQEQEVATQRSNVELVQRELQKKWGTDYTARLESKTAQLGFGKEFATGLAATHPQAFLSLMLDKDTPTGDVSPPNSSMRAPSGQDGKRNYAYYERMRKDNPKEYFSPRVQNEMHKQATSLGEGFYQ